MLKRVLIAAIFVFSLAQAGLAQASCQRYTEPLGGFSFCLPDGWNLMKREGQKFKTAYGPLNRDFTPTIVVYDETNPAPLTAYVPGVMKVTLDSYSKVGAASVEVLGQTNFITTNKTQGVRVALQTERNSLVISMLQYFFNGKEGQKFIVTCAALDKEKATLGPICDRALKTFQLEK